MYSDSSTEDQARKRRIEGEDREQGFERSKKTVRSTFKQQNKSDEKLDMIIKMMRDLKTDLKE